MENLNTIDSLPKNMKNRRVITLVVQPLITVAFLIIGSFLYSKIAGQVSININNGTSSQRTFTVDGTGKVTVKPDTFYTDFSIQQSGATQDQAKNKGNEIQQKAVAALKKLGFSNNDLKTQGYSINPDYSYNTGPDSKPTITGYTLYTTTRVTAKTSDKVNTAIDTLTPLGVNVSGVQSTVGDTEAYKSKAEALAVQQAKQKAEDLAKAAGFKLGKLASIKENNDNTGVIAPQPMILREKAFDASTSTQINPGTQEITSQVTLTYYITD